MEWIAAVRSAPIPICSLSPPVPTQHPGPDHRAAICMECIAAIRSASTTLPHTHTHTHTHKHTHTHAHTYTHIHTHTHRFPLRLGFRASPSSCHLQLAGTPLLQTSAAFQRHFPLPLFPTWHPEPDRQAAICVKRIAAVRPALIAAPMADPPAVHTQQGYKWRSPARQRSASCVHAGKDRHVFLQANHRRSQGWTPVCERPAATNARSAGLDKLHVDRHKNAYIPAR
eukprot:1159043-Pelagomonas_calceolata.AAC.11